MTIIVLRIYCKKHSVERFRAIDVNFNEKFIPRLTKKAPDRDEDESYIFNLYYEPRQNEVSNDFLTII